MCGVAGYPSRVATALQDLVLVQEHAAIIRYQEGATSEADFSGELSVLAIFDNPGGVSTFDDVNII